MADPKESELLGWEEAKKHLPPELQKPGGRPDARWAANTQQFAALLIRTNYLKKIGKLVPANWVAMEESELTEFLTKTYTEEQLKALFAPEVALRYALKNTARNFSLLAAVAVAFVWCREDLQKGNYWAAGEKFTLTVGGAYVLNQYFYGRDKVAADFMAKNMGNWGKTFQGLARGNRFVNFLTRRLATALLIWSFKDWLMSSGPDGPNFPFDLVRYIDIYDKSTWVGAEPPQGWLDFGCDYFYYQKPTEQFPGLGYQELCLGVVRGSLLRVPKRILVAAVESLVESFEERARDIIPDDRDLRESIEDPLSGYWQ